MTILKDLWYAFCEPFRMLNDFKDNHGTTVNEYSPYCPVCGSCGEDGCCSALSCKQHPDGDYCSTYLKDLQHGYWMNDWWCKNFFDKLTPEEKEAWEKEWELANDKIWKQS
jgi:hypothetical protein